MRKPIIAGNWKMYKTVEETSSFVKELVSELEPVILSKVEAVICAPFTNLPKLQELLHNRSIFVGAQNVYWENSGAYTGEISPVMLKNLNVSYCVVGHSERRTLFHETDEEVNKKVKALLRADIKPIICVGEDLAQREKGETKTIVKEQTTFALAGLSSKEMEKVVIAYEPIWAIGTGKTATSEDANAVIQFIRSVIADLYDQQVANQVRILYGGSVKPENIRGFMQQADIDGALVGGASLEVKSYIQLLEGAN